MFPGVRKRHLKRHTGNWTVKISSIPRNERNGPGCNGRGCFFIGINWLIFRSKTVDKNQNIAYTISAGRDTLYTHITEFTFKCHVLAPAVGPPKGGFLR